MKTKTIFKSLLVAAGLLVGSSAWAQTTTTLLEYGTNDVPWTTDNAAEWSGKTLSLAGDNSYVQYVGNDNSDFANSQTISPAANSIINVEAVWRGRSNTGRYWGNNCGIYFRFGNIVVAQNDQDKTHGYVLNGLANLSSVTKFTAGSYRVDIAECQWLKIDAEINTATNKLVSFTVKSEDGTKTYVNIDNVDLVSPDYTTVAFGFQRGGSHNTQKQEQLKSIKITQTTQDVAIANYTINYQLSGTTVKTVAGSSVVGEEITADVAIDGTEEGYVGNHYLITAADAPTMTLVADAASNVLNVPVRAPYTATLNLTTSIGGIAGEPVATVFTETDDKVCNWTYAFPLYTEKDGTYYISDETTTFGESGTFTNGEVINKTISYTNAEADVVYFYDGAKGTNYSLSNGSSENIGAQNARDRGLSVGTLPAGTYMFVVNITAANRRSVVIRQSTKDPIALVGTSNEDKTIGIKSAIFTLNEETDNLWINGANSGEVKTNQSEDYDYVLVKKLPASITATIGSDAIATFSSEYAVDFSAEDGVTVYTAKVNDAQTAVVLTAVESKKVPANTGVILKGDAGTYNAAVVASAPALENNQLAVSDGESNVQGAYVLTKSGDKVVFGVWDSETPLSKGRVYLPADVVDVVLSGAKTLNIIFEGETTGINDVSRLNNAEMTSDKVVFNLNGQRIAAPQKGINIINGRKYIVK